MKIRHEQEQSSKVSEDIEIDTVFSGAISAFNGTTPIDVIVNATNSIFLKTYIGIIDLKNPYNVWMGSGITVNNYKEINAELVVLE